MTNSEWLKSEVARLEAALQKQIVRADKAQAEVTSLQAEVTSLQAEVTSLQAEVTSLRERIKC